MVKESITIIIPALNEEGNLEEAVLRAASAAELHGLDYEILIFNDGSKDHTQEISESLARQNPRVTAIRHAFNRGIGYSFREGVRQARGNYIMLVPGDNEIHPESVSQMLARTGEADIILGHHAASHLRSPLRRLLSSFVVALMNALFRTRLSYFNGPNIIRKELFSGAQMKIIGFLYMAEIMIQLAQQKASIKEIGFRFNPRRHGKSTALKPKNLCRAALDFAGLIWRFRLRRKN